MSAPSRRPLLSAVAAYAWWGTIAPVFFRATRDTSSWAMLALRVLVGLPLLLLWLTATGQLGALRAALRSRRVLGALVISAALVGVNWMVFIVAVATDRTLAASFGYYLNPLFSIALGMLLLGERLTRRQAVAVGLAVIGVAWQAVMVGTLPWISVTLALTFGLYGLVRKRTPVEPAVGLTVEMIVLFLPMALLLAALPPGAVRAETGWHALLLAGAGPATVVPLALFAAGARGLRLATVGMLQYIAPTGQFLCAVLLFGEPLSGARLVSFAFVWAGVIVFVWPKRRGGGVAKG